MCSNIMLTTFLLKNVMSIVHIETEIFLFSFDLFLIDLKIKRKHGFDFTTGFPTKRDVLEIRLEYRF